MTSPQRLAGAVGGFQGDLVGSVSPVLFPSMCGRRGTGEVLSIRELKPSIALAASTQALAEPTLPKQRLEPDIVSCRLRSADIVPSALTRVSHHWIPNTVLRRIPRAILKDFRGYACNRHKARLFLRGLFLRYCIHLIAILGI